jgi:DNA-binding LacI/PurR family transcriptional regulator
VRRARPPDAIFVGNDHMAFAVMDVLRFDLGLAVPSDVSVVGYDDVPMAAWPAYDLTTIRQPVNRMVDATVDAAGPDRRRPRPRRNPHRRAADGARSARIPEGYDP